MKKYLRIISILLLCIALCGCKKSADEGEKEPELHTNEISEKQAPAVTKIPEYPKVVVNTAKFTDKVMSQDGKTTLLLGDYSYPQIKNESNVEAIQKVNDDIYKKTEKDFQESFEAGKKYAQEFYDKNNAAASAVKTLPFVTEQRFEVTYNDNYILSFRIKGYVDYGGAHPSPYQKAYTYDTKTGELLDINYFFEKSAKAAKEFVAQSFYTIFTEQPDVFYPETGELLTKGKFNYGYYLTQEGITFFINVYDIAPYAAGVQEFSLLFDRKMDSFNNLDRILPTEN